MKVIRKRRRRRVSRYNSYGGSVGFTTRKKSKAPIIVAMTFCAVLLVFTVCALCLKYLSDRPAYSIDEVTPTEPCVIENGQNTSLIINTGDIHILTVPKSDDNYDSITFSSSDESVLEVDSGGRVDAIKEGVAVITAQGEDFSGQCTVTVKKRENDSKKKEYTTAITANLDVVEKNKEDSSKALYNVKINRRTNTVTVYTYDDKGDYVVPVRAMVCSCGEMNEENITPTGEYSVYFKNYWHALFGDVYGKYVTGFSGHYLFHSVPYEQTESYTLKSDEFNKLGTNASQGCVRMMIADAKWIYDNLDMYTEVIVIDADEKEDPLGKPETVKIEESACWDPTDPHKSNPFKTVVPIISGAKDITVKKDSDFVSKVTAVDSCNQDITEKIEVIGNVITSKAGKYKVTYRVTDSLGKSAEKTVTITVE
ncbi:MAG: L,D-transpeptidase family protein [Ruminococcus sp.]|nr:L,D-transpeptidase family protein [Ruminococcus sp.]